ncbi:MAG: alpha-glucan family phosphorylase [bacterium]|nr:alpha-glucan family phosphorylase [bacterium]
MPNTIELHVKPVIPKEINRLKEIAYNFWFSWNPEALWLFSSIDRPLWRKLRHNPVEFLNEVSQHKLEKASKDRTYLLESNKVMATFDHYMSKQKTWYTHRFDDREKNELIAYFAAEYGIHESLAIYSGGLGVLSADHCKAASDLGLPFVAVGLLYRRGYFTQKIDGNGNQIAEYIDNEFDKVPIQQVLDKEGKPLVVAVDVTGRDVYVTVWEAKIGRISLYLLDTDIERNNEKDRLITCHLYGGELETRISQEIILGMGGVRVLAAMGMRPTVWHINEGHSVLMGFERIRSMVKEEGLSFYEALEVFRSTTVFTTHTPVPAGHDVFPLEMKEYYFKHYWEEVGLTRDEFMALGLEERKGTKLFNLTRLAFKLANYTNGVSLLHSKITSKMWERLWPDIPIDENPIFHITNGIHTFTWIAPPMADLFDQYLGQEWRSNLSEIDFWKKVEAIPDDIYWGVRKELKRRMIEVIRANLKKQRIRNKAAATEIREIENILDPDILTIGFARRFATYKRANLLFRDIERLKRIVTHPQRPVQIVFTGKAHPADHPAQDIIRQIYQITQQSGFRKRIVLLENYDINIARCLVSGVDVWLNTPKRPYEASGTSGQKVAVNGGLNFSILDGWWAEAAQDNNGWVIGDDREFDDEEKQNMYDSESLYSLLEEEIIPLYYQENEKGYSSGWVNRSKESVRTIAPVYNTDRMVREYTRKCYIKASDSGRKCRANNYAVAREISSWKKKVSAAWPDVKLSMAEKCSQEFCFGEEKPIKILADLSTLQPADVTIELYIKKNDEEKPSLVPLEHIKEQEEGGHLYQGIFSPPDSGRYMISVRAIPSHPELLHKHETGLCKWL